MSSFRIPFIRPELPPLSVVSEDFEQIWRDRRFSNSGSFDRRLAQRLARYLGVAHCIPVANATLGLMLAARAIGPEDRPCKALLPTFTFPASALALEWAGFEPVFCDIDPYTWQPQFDVPAIRASGIELGLLLSCNTFGAPGDIEAWRAAANDLEVPLLIDSASGLGSEYADGRKVGAAGVPEVFSLHATKTFGVGEGGIIATADAALAERLLRDRNFGLSDDGVCTSPGLNAKLAEIQAAIACHVLDRHDETVATRRHLAQSYRRLLHGSGVEFQRHGEQSTYQCVSVLLPSAIDRSDVQRHLRAMGIETRTYFSPPLHQQPHFRRRERLGTLATSEDVGRRILSLPVHNDMTETTVEEVSQALREALAWHPQRG